MMRFKLANPQKRLFVAERFCFLGRIDDWIYLDGPDPLEPLVRKYAGHLGKEGGCGADRRMLGLSPLACAALRKSRPAPLHYREQAKGFGSPLPDHRTNQARKGETAMIYTLRVEIIRGP